MFLVRFGRNFWIPPTDIWMCSLHPSLPTKASLVLLCHIWLLRERDYPPSQYPTGGLGMSSSQLSIEGTLSPRSVESALEGEVGPRLFFYFCFSLPSHPPGWSASLHHILPRVTSCSASTDRWCFPSLLQNPETTSWPSFIFKTGGLGTLGGRNFSKGRWYWLY